MDEISEFQLTCNDSEKDSEEEEIEDESDEPKSLSAEVSFIIRNTN